MKKITFTLLLAFAFLLTNNMNAQEYKSAVGVKLGYGLVGTYKMFLNDKAAIDVFGGIRWGGLAAGAYYLMHNEIPSVDKLSWYWGGGVSFTTWDYGVSGLDNYYELGISGVIGLDYSFDEFPLNVSVDWAPTFVVVDSWDYSGTYNRFRSGYGALSARYILKR
ncbi:MAG: hypothetical protein IPH57_06300 [Saprospiraceae bacterium]|jgi:hypothetical protein|nr:hypothetical protein [Saprospiraceae bacterium]